MKKIIFVNLVVTLIWFLSMPKEEEIIIEKEKIEEKIIKEIKEEEIIIEKEKIKEEIIKEIKEKEEAVVITKYRPLPEETDDTPLQTADLSEISMLKLYRGEIKWVAVSRDLLKKYGYGSKIKISTGDPEIDGIYEVHDTMNKRWTSRIDILTHPKHPLGKGRWEGKISKI